MTTTMKTALSLAGLALVGSGAVLWAHFGRVIFFDLSAADLLGCFF